MSKWILATAALLLSGGLQAQTFKCIDKAGKVTYSGMKCSDLKLKDGGEVKERLQSGPGDRSALTPRPAPPPAPQRAPEAEPAAAPAKAEGGERRCFTTKAGTRCGEKQVE